MKLLQRFSSFLLIALTALAVIPASVSATQSPSQDEINAWQEKLDQFRAFLSEGDRTVQIPSADISPTTPSTPSYQLKEKLGDWLIIETEAPSSAVERSCITGYKFRLSEKTQIQSGGAESRFEQVRSFYNKTGQYPKSASELLALLYPLDGINREEAYTYAATWVHFSRPEPVQLLYPDHDSEPQVCDTYIRHLTKEETATVLSTLPAPPGSQEGKILSFWYKRVVGEEGEVIDSSLSTYIKQPDSSPPGTSI